MPALSSLSVVVAVLSLAATAHAKTFTLTGETITAFSYEPDKNYEEYVFTNCIFKGEFYINEPKAKLTMKNCTGVNVMASVMNGTIDTSTFVRGGGEGDDSQSTGFDIKSGGEWNVTNSKFTAGNRAVASSVSNVYATFTDCELTTTVVGYATVYLLAFSYSTLKFVRTTIISPYDAFYLSISSYSAISFDSCVIKAGGRAFYVSESWTCTIDIPENNMVTGRCVVPAGVKCPSSATTEAADKGTNGGAMLPTVVAVTVMWTLLLLV